MLRLTVLMDNHTEIDAYYLGEPAVSYWLETEGKHFLFDTGYSKAFLQNAKALHIDVTTTDTVILSHGHNDHTGGLKPLLEMPFSKKPKLLTHPNSIPQKIYQGLEIGMPLSYEELDEKTELILTKKPFYLTEKLIFLGEIPKIHPHEPSCAIGKTKMGADFLEEDTALAYCGKEGLYIITGCSHAGICNIISYAQKVTGYDKIAGIIGGFHLFTLHENAKKTIDFLAKMQIPHLYPCHCTSFAVRAALHEKCPVTEVGVGMELVWS